MLAYETRCAVCAFGHRELLDAAHIIPDNDPRGLPIVPNGLALVQDPPPAYDRNILGIRPDYVSRSTIGFSRNSTSNAAAWPARPSQRVADATPWQRADQPDPDRLLERYIQFRAA